MSPSKLYHPFELEIKADTNGYCARVLASPTGETEGKFDFPFSQEEWGNLSAFLPEEIGGRIFDAIFTGPVGERWSSSLARLGSTEGLRLNLRLPDTPELASLPWELLYDTAQHYFLALAERTPINRYLPLPLPHEDLAVEPPLQVLVILAAPEDHQPLLDVEAEWQSIHNVLSPLIRSGHIELQRMAEATWTELQSHLRSKTTHILHFVGHGLFDDRQGGGLLFEDEDGFVQLISARKLAHLLRNHPSLRMVVLNSCDGAVSNALNPFSGMAQALVQQGIPAVIAMQQEVSDHASIVFGPTFYSAIADGYPIDAALTQARLAVYAESEYEWATPVLFMRAADGQLFDFAKLTNSQEPEPRLMVPAPIPPPDIDIFVGREQEAAYHIQTLETENLTVITGMLGVGKTMLAATIAKRMSNDLHVFWHSFLEDEQSDVLVWKMAAFLAWHDKPELWQMLRDPQGTSDNTPPPETLFDFLLEILSGQEILICLDNFQCVDKDPLILRLIERLHHLSHQKKPKLLIVTQRTPSLGVVSSFQTLSGLRLEEMRHLLDTSNLLLNESLIEELHSKTDGNPQLLTLAVNLLQQGHDPHLLITDLIASVDAERFLLDGIDANLTALERDVLIAVAIFQGEACTRDALETVLESEQGLLRTLSDLSVRHLLTVSHTPNGRVYDQNKLIGDFYYHLLASPKRKKMHQSVGCYFESLDEGELPSLRQYRLAGEFDHFARVLFESIGKLLNQGQVVTIRMLLDQIPLSRFSQQAQIQVSECHGDSLYLLGLLDESIDSFEHAIQLAASDKPLHIRLARKRGDVLTRAGEYDRARESYGQAGELLAETDLPEERALLHVGIGTLRLAVGEYDEVLAEVQSVLARFDVAMSPLVVAELHDLLGKAFYFKGDLANSAEHFELALAKRRVKVENLRGVLRSHSNLAVIYGAQQRLDDAVSANQAALEIAERIGDTIALTLLYTNLASDYAELRQNELAVEFYRKGLVLAERIGNVQGLRLAHHNLADEYRELMQFDSALTHIRTAIDLADQTDDSHLMIACRLTLAEIYIDLQNQELAELEARRAFELAEETGDMHWLPVCIDLLGKISKTIAPKKQLSQRPASSQKTFHIE